MRKSPLRRRTLLRAKKALNCNAEKAKNRTAEKAKNRTVKPKARLPRRSRRAIRMTAADQRWAEEVKRRAGYRCEYDGTFYGKGHRGLHAHHIFSRAIKATRHDPENGVALCYGHHRGFAHRHPLDFHEWIRTLRGEERYISLQAGAKRPNIGLDMDQSKV